MGSLTKPTKAAVKKRFVRWVADLGRRERDQAWLDYQEEIGLRHTPAKKNATDHAHTLRLFLTTAKEFLAKKGRSAEEVERMQAAWTKAVTLSLALWSRPYPKQGLW